MKLWNPRRYKVPVITLICLVLIIYFFISASRFFWADCKTFEINEGWTIKYNGHALSSDNVLDSGIDIVNLYDTVALSTTLDDYGILNPCLHFHSIHAVVMVLLDDKVIYSFGESYLKNDKTAPKYDNYIPLGNDYAGKELIITLTGSRNHSFSSLSPIIIGERNQILKAKLLSCLNDLFMGAFLIVMGIILMILSPYFFFYHRYDFRLFFSGVISLLFGLYTYSYYGFIDFLINNIDLNTICEYSSLYNIPTAILGYLMSINKGKEKKIFTAFFIINIIAFFTVFVMTVLGSARINEFTAILQGLAFLEALLVIYFMIQDTVNIRKATGHFKITSDNTFAIGLFLFIILAFSDIIKYNISKYLSIGNSGIPSIDGYVFGATVFVSSLLISYLIYILDNSDLESKQIKVSSLAYTDPLTGLSNRARCEQIMTALSDERETYTIISLDLNRLKEINDTLGHHEGDRLISGFATILSDCFIDASLVGRMGGDEFIVILTDESAVHVTRKIHNFYSTMNDWNRKEQHFKYSASYGYAYSYEVPSGSAQEVYMLADNRMYEMKREHHRKKIWEVNDNA